MQIIVKKRLVYGAMTFIWIIVPAYLTSMASSTSDILPDGSCVPGGVYSSNLQQKIIHSSVFIIEYLFPLLTMIFFYSRIIYKLRHAVNVRIVVFKGRLKMQVRICRGGKRWSGKKKGDIDAE